MSARDLRGQSISLDFVAGLFIFLVLVSYFIILWDMFSARYPDALRRQAAEIAAVSISEQLVSTSGYPANWSDDPPSAKAIGLARTPGVLDWGLISALESMPYGQAKEALSLDRDFLIKVDSAEGVRHATVGSEPNSTIRAIEISRAAVLDGETVYVRVQLYDS